MCVPPVRPRNLFSLTSPSRLDASHLLLLGFTRISVCLSVLYTESITYQMLLPGTPAILWCRDLAKEWPVCF